MPNTATTLRRAQRVYYRNRRKALAVVLRAGSGVTCTVCGWSGRQFMASRKPRRPNRICPACTSSERYRAFDIWLRERGTPAPGARLLEVAPTHTVERLATELGYRYTSIDLKSPRARTHADLCNLPFADETFDVVVCFHVLEHIPADGEAAAELVRVADAAGEAVVVVPWDPGRPDTFEDPDADPADYERLYGQSDHVRIYGRDAPDRWANPAMAIDERPWDGVFTPDQRKQHALDGDDDRFWVLTRA